VYILNINIVLLYNYYILICYKCCESGSTTKVVVDADHRSSEVRWRHLHMHGHIQRMHMQFICGFQTNWSLILNQIMMIILN